MAKRGAESFIIPGCLFIGLGIGIATNQTAVGVIIGLGVGFVLTFIFAKLGKK